MPRFPTQPITVTTGALYEGPPGPQGPPGSTYVHRYTYYFLAGSAVTDLGSATPYIAGSIRWSVPWSATQQLRTNFNRAGVSY